MLPLPGIGSVSGFSGKRKHSEAFFKFTSFTEPGAIYRCSSDAAKMSNLLFVAFACKVNCCYLSSSSKQGASAARCRFDAAHPEQEPKVFRRIKLNVDMSPDDFVTRQVGKACIFFGSSTS